MAFVPGYEYDIFISYAHVDNMVEPGQSKGWIEHFFYFLKDYLAKRFGRPDKVSFWWDNRKLDPNILFDNAIEEGIKKSAVFLCLNSQGYLESEFCQKELSLFSEKAGLEPIGHSVGSRSRFLHVLLNNIPSSDWPAPLKGTTGFPFHDAIDEQDFGDTIGILSPQFTPQMQNLKDAIWELLSEFRRRQLASSGQPAPVARSSSFTVFLGEVSDNLRKTYDRITTELTKNDISVVGGIPPPYDAVAHEQTVRQMLEKSHLAIHLFDEVPGKSITGQTETWYPVKQAQIALGMGRPQLIWVPDRNLDIEYPEYRSFLEDLENTRGRDRNFDFVRCYPGELSGIILDHVKMLKLAMAVKSPASGTPSVLLDTHFRDQEYAVDLYNLLLENRIRTYINPQEDDPLKNISLLEERIMKVKTMIFLYGTVSGDWVRERISAALHLILKQRCPVENFYIYLAPPHKDPSDLLPPKQLLNVNVIDNSDDAGVSPEKALKLVNEILNATP